MINVQKSHRTMAAQLAKGSDLQSIDCGLGPHCRWVFFLWVFSKQAPDSKLLAWV